MGLEDLVEALQKIDKYTVRPVDYLIQRGIDYCVKKTEKKIPRNVGSFGLAFSGIFIASIYNL